MADAFEMGDLLEAELFVQSFTWQIGKRDPCDGSRKSLQLESSQEIRVERSADATADAVLANENRSLDREAVPLALFEGPRISIAENLGRLLCN